MESKSSGVRIAFTYAIVTLVWELATSTEQPVMLYHLFWISLAAGLIELCAQILGVLMRRS